MDNVKKQERISNSLKVFICFPKEQQIYYLSKRTIYFNPFTHTGKEPLRFLTFQFYKHELQLRYHKV